MVLQQLVSLKRPFTSHWHTLVPEVSINSNSVMMNSCVAKNAKYFSEIIENEFHQATIFPQSQIRIAKGSSYHSEISMNRPQ